MIALLLSTLLLLAPVGTTSQPPPCEGLLEAADRAYSAVDLARPATLHTYMARSREARACYTATQPERIARLYPREAHVLQRLERHQEALDLLDTFLNEFAALPIDSTVLHWIYQKRGDVLYDLSNLNDGAGSYARALDYAAGESKTRQAQTYLSYGSTLQRLRDFQAAGRNYRQAQRLLQPEDRSDTSWRRTQARCFILQADLLLEQDAPNAAARPDSLHKSIALLNESLALLRDLPPNVRIVQANVLLGDAYRELDDLDTAYPHHRRALEVAPNVTAEINDKYWHYLAIYKMGRYYLQAEDYDRAEETLLEAYARVSDAHHLDHDRRVLNALGLVYAYKGDLPNAAFYYRKGIKVTERYRASLRTTDWSATAFSRWLSSYRGLVRVLLAQQKPAEAFQILEQTRARHLQDLRIQLQLQEGFSAVDSLRFDSLTTALAQTMSRLASDTLDAEERNSLRLKRTQLTTARRRLIDLDTNFVMPSLASIQQVLAQREQVVLSYFIDSGNQRRTAQSHVFVLTADTLTAVPLRLSSDSLRALMAQVSPLLTKTDGKPDFNARLFSLTALKHLHDALYAPVASFVQPGQRLVIIPDGSLFMLPFGILAESVPAHNAYGSTPFLLKKHPIGVEMAAALLIDEPLNGTPATFDVVAYGKSTFTARRAAETYRSPDLYLPDIPAVRQEIASIKKHIGNVRTLLDAAATEAAFLENSPSAKVLHLASHAIIDISSPLRNAVVLSEDPIDKQHDGLLYLHEIQRQRLAAHLVVLSGCNTARGVLLPGEGMESLQHAFRAMGVRSSLATLWFVEDNATGRLMEAFYENLQAGLTKDRALQQAQLAYLDQVDEGLRSPFYWSAPVLYGDPQALTLAAPSRWMWILGGTLLIVLLLIVISRHRLRRRQLLHR